MQKVDFGTVEVTEILDDNSKRTIQTTYRKGAAPVKRVRYEIRVQVKNQADEHRAYLEFSNELANDKTMLDPSWKIEHNRRGNENGYYYVTKGFTKLEPADI